MRGPHWEPVLLGVLAVTAMMPTPAASQAQDRPATIALLAGEADRAPSPDLVALLEATLSKEPTINVVERALLEKILQEQHLSVSGLADPQTIIRVGQLSSVDLFAFIERIPNSRPPACRLQITEAGSGVVLVRSAHAEQRALQQPNSMIEEIRHALEKQRVPMKDRLFVGLLGFRSEEPGSALDGLAEAFGVFLLDDLARSPSVVVLDREHLRHLSDEKNLTNLQLLLRSSATLIDAGIRREGHDGELRATIQLRGLAGRTPQTVQLRLSPGDPIAARATLARELRKTLNASPIDRQPPRPGVEARQFADRARMHLAYREHEKAVRAAEAARALAPSREHQLLAADSWRLAAKYYGSLRQDLNTRQETQVLRACIRRYSLLGDVCSAGPESQPSVALDGLPTPRVGDAHELQRISVGTGHARVDLLWEKLEAEVARYAECLLELHRDHLDDPQAQVSYWAVWEGYLAHRVFANAPRSTHRLEIIRRVVEDFTHLDLPKRLSKNSSRRLHEPRLRALLPIAATYSIEGAPPPHRAPLIDLLGELTQNPNPYVRMIAFHGLANWGESPLLSAERVVEVFVEEIGANHPYLQPSVPFAVVDIIGEALGIIAKRDIGRLTPRCLEIIQPYERSDEDTRLADWRRVLTGWIRWLRLADRGAEALEQTDHLLSLLSRQPVSRRRPLVSELIAELERTRRALAERVPASSPQGPRRNHDLAAAEGLWSAYTGKRVDVRHKHETSFPTHVFAAGRQLVCVRGKTTNLRVAVHDLDQPDYANPVLDIAVRSDAVARHTTTLHRDTAFANGGDMFYIGTDAGLFAVSLADGSARVMTTDDGLPSNGVLSLAWLRNHLYIGFGTHPGRAVSGRQETRFLGGLARYDPARGTFHLLASNRATNTDGPLDGGLPYAVVSLAADETHGCLYLGIGSSRQERSRQGVWRYTPTPASGPGFFERLCPGETNLRKMTWIDGGLLLSDPSLAKIFDPTTKRRTYLFNPLGHREPSEPLFRIEHPRDYVMLGEDLWIETRDGISLLTGGQADATTLARTPDGREAQSGSILTGLTDGIALQLKVGAPPNNRPRSELWVMRQRADRR